MNNIPEIAVYIVTFLAILGWICSEIVSRKLKAIEDLYNRRHKLLNKEKLKLEMALAKQRRRSVKIEKDCVPLRESEAAAPVLEKNHKKLSRELTHFHRSLDALRVKLSNRDYSSNPVASDALNILEEFCPNEEERKAIKQTKLASAFTRIKNSMDNNLQDQ